MKRVFQLAACLLLTGAVLLAEEQQPPASGQAPPDRDQAGERRPGRRHHRDRMPRPEASADQAGAPQQGPPPDSGQEQRRERGFRRGPKWNNAGIPPLLFKLAEKPPDEQERLLQSNPRFRQLPAEDQQRLRDKLRRISAMSPEERARLRERFEIYHKLPFEAREKIREEIWPAWSRMAPERRQAMLSEFRSLRHMPPSERDKRLKCDDFNKTYSADEQQLLRQLATLAPQED